MDSRHSCSSLRTLKLMMMIAKVDWLSIGYPCMPGRRSAAPWPDLAIRSRAGPIQNNFFFQVSGVFSLMISKSMWYLNGFVPRFRMYSTMDTRPSLSLTCVR